MTRKQLVPLDLNANRVTNVADPTANKDAVTRDYLRDNYDSSKLVVLALGKWTGSGTARYSPSSGETGIIRKIYATNEGNIADTALCYLRNPTTFTNVGHIFYNIQLGAYQSIEIDLHLPIDYGESLYAGSTAGQVSYLVEGEVWT